MKEVPTEINAIITFLVFIHESVKINRLYKSRGKTNNPEIKKVETTVSRQ